MKRRMFSKACIGLGLLVLSTFAVIAHDSLHGVAFAQDSIFENKKIVPFVPTPQEVVDKMIELAGVKKGDLVYDLGSGDGRIVITAAKKYGARGIGVDIDPDRVAEAKQNAKTEGVTDKVEFREGDLFKMDLSEASVVTLYLLSSINLKLRPKLLEELKPGTRIVSHSFDMGDWKPEYTEKVDGSTVYYWTIPEKAKSGQTAKAATPSAAATQ